MRNHLTFIFYGVILCSFAATGVWAQDYYTGMVMTVNSTADSIDASPGDGVCADASGRCTLRAAIDESETSVAPDAIMFNLPAGSVIDLTLGELRITRNLDVVGPGARRLTIRRSLAPGTPQFRIFHTGLAYVAIRGLTIMNGRADTGGGVFADLKADLGLFDVVITGNHALNGGGVSAGRQFQLVHSLVIGNVADESAGGVLHTGTDLAPIVSSTLTGNSSSTGGAIYNANGDILLVNDTINANTAASAASVANASGNALVINTIIGRDVSTTSLQGTFQSLGHNIVTNSLGSTGFVNGVNGDQVSESNVIDPMLGDLADNGGQTDTRAVLPGSPAADNGDPCVIQAQCQSFPPYGIGGLGSDQRHLFRHLFVEPMDIGAYESDGTQLEVSGSYGIYQAWKLPSSLFVNTPVRLIDPVTFETVYQHVKLNGTVQFNNVPLHDVWIYEALSKRKGILTPLVFANDY